MTSKPLLVAAAVATIGAAILTTAPALAITGGGPDTVHTNVGVVRFTLPEGRFRCSGTLISSTVVLTAGHCTEGPATNVLVSFNDALVPDPSHPTSARPKRPPAWRTTSPVPPTRTRPGMASSASPSSTTRAWSS
jgi:hypothetical protein